MSDTQSIWMALWSHAAANPDARQPFEISEVVPEVARVLGIGEEDAPRRIRGLLKELARLPEGRRYFIVEGNAIVPRPEFVAALGGSRAALDVYPYEL